MTRFLVGILRCGEQEYAACRRALDRQTVRDIAVFTISDQPNKAAHEALYARFMAAAGQYRFALKLDADMVLARDDALARLAALMEPSDGPPLDRLMVDVRDWPSGLMIPGLTVHSDRVRWGANPDRLMVDHKPDYDGPSRRYLDLPLVDHMPDPSDWQLFRYGVHRALKAIQPDRADKNLGKALLHWDILKAIARKRRPGCRRRFALMGAEAVFSGQHPALLGDYAGAAAKALFRAQQRRCPEAVEAALAPLWDHPLRANDRWLELLSHSDWRQAA